MASDSFHIIKEFLRETSLLTGSGFFQTATQILARLLKADFVFIAYLKDQKHDEMEVLGSWKEGKALGVWSFILPGTPCALIYEDQKDDWKDIRVGGTVCVNELLRSRFEGARDSDYEVFIGVPMRNARENLIGHIALFFKKNWSSETDRDRFIELVELLSYRVQSELNRYSLEKERQRTLQELEKTNKSLKQETITDPLTQLYNRRYFSRKMQEAFTQFKDIGFNYSLLILDIDHFKSINDQYGHDVGDAVLVRVSSIILVNCREDFECLFRIGGEEFAILSQWNHSPSTFQGFSERINQIFRETPIEEISGRVLTVSIGGAFPMPGDTSWDSLYKRADLALYQAKESGRDRTVITESH